MAIDPDIEDTDVVVNIETGEGDVTPDAGAETAADVHAENAEQTAEEAAADAEQAEQLASTALVVADETVETALNAQSTAEQALALGAQNTQDIANLTQAVIALADGVQTMVDNPDALGGAPAPVVVDALPEDEAPKRQHWSQRPLWGNR